MTMNTKLNPEEKARRQAWLTGAFSVRPVRPAGGNATVYKIRNKAGLYSTGGSQPRWTKRGKTWVALNHVNAHLTLIRTETERWNKMMTGTLWTELQKHHMRENADNSINPYLDCDVIEFEMFETGCRGIVLGVQS